MVSVDVKHHVYLLTSTFIAERFHEDPFTCEREEDQKARGFQVSHFNRSFSLDVMAVKGLKKNVLFNLCVLSFLQPFARSTCLCVRV